MGLVYAIIIYQASSVLWLFILHYDRLNHIEYKIE